MRFRGDDGVTLVELLVVIVMMPLLIGAVSLVLTTWVRTNDATRERVEESNAATFAAHYFVPDVQRAARVNETAACGAGTPVLTLDWLGPDPAGTAYVTAAWMLDGSGEGQRLVRRTCAPDGTVTNEITVARRVTVAACSSEGGGPCAAGSRELTLSITELSGFAFSVEGIRRIT